MATAQVCLISALLLYTYKYVYSMTLANLSVTSTCANWEQQIQCADLKYHK